MPNCAKCGRTIGGVMDAFECDNIDCRAIFGSCCISTDGYLCPLCGKGTIRRLNL